MEGKLAIQAAPAASSQEVEEAQLAAMTRVVEVVREIVVEVPAPPLAAGSYTECEVCVGRGMTDRYGQTPAATERIVLTTGTGDEVATIEACLTHVSYVQATATRCGFHTTAGPLTAR